VKTLLALALGVLVASDDPKPAPKPETPAPPPSSILLDLRLQSLQREAAWLESLEKKLREGQPIEASLLDERTPERPAEAPGPKDPEIEGSIQAEETKLRALRAELDLRQRLASKAAERSAESPGEASPAPSPKTAETRTPAETFVDPVLAGDLWFRRGEFERALAAYEQVPAKAPFADWASLRAARCLEKLGRLDGAEARYASFRATFHTGPFLVEAEFGLEITRLKKTLEGKQ
jgi:tetratricopeptide (TPR) repeat protein